MTKVASFFAGGFKSAQLSLQENINAMKIDKNVWLWIGLTSLAGTGAAHWLFNWILKMPAREEAEKRRLEAQRDSIAIA